MGCGSRVLGLFSGVLLLGVSHAGANPLSILSAVGGAPNAADSYFNFDNLSVGTGSPQIDSAYAGSGSVTVTLTPDAQVVQGAASGVYAAPFLSSSNGVSFGDNTVSGADATKYLTTGAELAPHPNAALQLTFSGGSEKYLGLLWGSVDTYNTLTFYRADNSVIGSITGTDVNASANGDQGASGTYYVNINSTDAFAYVIATSTQYAFEFDNVAVSAQEIGRGGLGDAPLPAAAWLFGSVLFGSGVVMRRRRKAPVSAAKADA